MTQAGPPTLLPHEASYYNLFVPSCTELASARHRQQRRRLGEDEAHGYSQGPGFRQPGDVGHAFLSRQLIFEDPV